MTISRLWIFVVIAFGISSAGCGRNPDAAKESSAPADAPKKVTTAPKLTRMTFTHKIECPGEIQAEDQTPIFAKITGYVQKINTDIGSRVAAGDVLAELSVPEYDEDAAQKDALVAQAKAELERARKLHAAAVANVQVAAAKILEARAARLRADAELTRAGSTYERLKKSAAVLADENIAEAKLGFEAAKANVAEVESKVKSAEASELESTAKRDTAHADIDVAAARLRVAEASARSMREILKYAKLTAPYAGVVVKRNIDLGHQVAAATGKSEPAFVVARMSPVRIYVDVPENDAGLIKDDAADQTKVAIRVQALKGEEFKGTVKRTSWALDPKSRILKTEIDLPNPDGKLRPGMYAFAIISIVHKDVWAIPASALVTKNNQSFCSLVEDGKSRLVPVLTGFRTPEFVEVTKRQSDGDGTWVDFTGKEEIGQ